MVENMIGERRGAPGGELRVLGHVGEVWRGVCLL